MTHNCRQCALHYGDSGLCDEGKPLDSPHRIKGVQYPPENCRDCGAPFNNAEPGPNGRCVACKVRVECLWAREDEA